MSLRKNIYPAVHLALMLIGGILVADALWGVASVFTWLCLLLVVLVVWLVVMVFFRNGLTESLLTHLAFFCLGAVLCNYAESEVRLNLPAGEIEYDAILLTEPERHGKVVMADMRLVSGPLTGKKVKASILRDTIDNHWLSLHVGSRLKARSRMEAPQNFNGSQFNYRRWMESHGYVARTFIYYRNWHAVDRGWAGLSRIERLRLRAYQLRTQLLQRFSSLKGDEYAVVAAMSLGDKTQLTKDLRNRYADAGASHVLAISGMHLSIVCGVFALFGLRRRRVWSLALLIVGLWSYAVLTGLSPSVVRACVMLTIYAIGLLYTSSNISLNALALAALLMLMVDPLMFWDVSFQMSFASMLGILLLAPPFYSFLPARFEHPEASAHVWRREMHPRGNAMVRAFWSLCSMSVSAQLAVAPLSAYYFGRIPCYFLLTNLIIFLLVSLILYGAIALLLLAGLPFVGQWASTFVETTVRWFNQSLSFIAQLPGASISGLSLSGFQLLLVYIALTSFLIAFFILTRPYRRNKIDRDDVFLTHHWTIRDDSEVEPYSAPKPLL